MGPGKTGVPNKLETNPDLVNEWAKVYLETKSYVKTAHITGAAAKTIRFYMKS